MNFHQKWMIGEIIFVIVCICFAVITMRKRKTPRKRPVGAWGWLAYTLRILGVGAGALLFVAVLIILERVALSVHMETQPAPSEVTIPPDLGFEVQEVTFESEDGILLAGWYVPPANNATIILLHGYGGNRTSMIWHAQHLVSSGYGVLMYDQRASGESGGEYRSYGWEDTRDTKAAIQFLETQGASENIGMVGCSRGATIGLYSTALYPELDAVWADGPGSVRAKDFLWPDNVVQQLFVPPNYIMDWMYMLRGLDAPAPLVDVIGQIAPRPILLVAGGTNQPLVGNEASLFIHNYAEAAGGNAEVWVIPEATHCDGPIQRSDEYSDRLLNFFNSVFGIE